MLDVGQAVPTFAVADDTGATHSLKDHVGSWIVVWFYIKDATSG